MITNDPDLEEYTWFNLLKDALELRGETIDDIVHIARYVLYDGYYIPLPLDDSVLNMDLSERNFTATNGAPKEGYPFTAWTKTRIYYPVGVGDHYFVKSVPYLPNFSQQTENYLS